MNPEMETISPHEAPRLPVRVAMASRWILWGVASVVLPVLPWLTPLVDDKDMTLFVVTTGFAVLCQFATSIGIGVGIGRKRGFGAAGTFGMCILFTIISLAIASAVYFLSFMIFVMVLYEKAGP